MRAATHLPIARPSARTIAALVMTSVCVLVLALMPSPARGASSYQLDGTILRVTSDAGSDAITLDCASSTILYNAFPTGISCASITEIRLMAGGGSDTIDLGGMTTSEFPSLTKTTLNGGPGTDSITGWAGRDILKGGSGSDALTGLLGNDTFIGGKGGDYTDRIDEAADGNMTLTATKLTGVFGTDTHSQMEMAELSGGGSANTIDASGFPGRVTLIGGNNNDILKAGQDGSTLYGGSGLDTLIGGKGSDSLRGETNNDTISGMGGNDSIQPDTTSVVGSDSIDGGAGRDSISYTGVNNGTVSDSGATILGVDTFASIEAGYVNSSNNAGVSINASGFSGPIQLLGADGVDTLTGGSGNDDINGYANNDILNGGPGSDRLSANANAVTNTLTPTTATANGADTISGFEAARLFGTSASQTFNVGTFVGAIDISTGDGNDTINGNGAKTTVQAADSGTIIVTDTLIDGPTYNVTTNSVGHLEIYGDNGDDTIDAHAVSKTTNLYGYDGTDILLGGSKTDGLWGEAGKDTLRGFKGNDTLYGLYGKDALDGGKGTDRCDGTKKDTVKSCEKKAPVYEK